MGNTARAAETGFERPIQKVVDMGAQFAEATRESATHVKSMVTNALEDGVLAARRMARRGRYAAEDLKDQAAHSIKRHPFKATAMCFGVGVGLGAMTLWLARRNGNR